MGPADHPSGRTGRRVEASEVLTVDAGPVVDRRPSRIVPVNAGRSRRPSLLALAAYLLLAAGLTIGPLPQDEILDSLIALIGHVSGRVSELAVEAPSNVLLFVPLGFLLARGFPAWPGPAVWALCLLGSVGVEAIQAGFLPGRVPSVLDVAMNGLGAALGVLLAYLLTRRAAAQSVRQQ
jgi:VanZ like family